MEGKSDIDYRLCSLSHVRPQSIARLAAFLHEHHPDMGSRCARLLIQRAIRTGWLLLLVLKHTGQVAGIVGYHEAKASERAGYGVVAPLALTPSAHRHGLGPWLLRLPLLYRRLNNHGVPLFAVPQTLPAEQRDTLAAVGFSPGDSQDVPSGLGRQVRAITVLRHDPHRLSELAAAVAGFTGRWFTPDGTGIRLDLGDLQFPAIGTMLEAVTGLGSRSGAWDEDELCRCEG